MAVACGQRLRQAALDGVIHELVHGPRIAKTDFGFGGVHVDIDQCGINGEEEADAGRAATMQHVALVGADTVFVTTDAVKKIEEWLA